MKNLLFVFVASLLLASCAQQRYCTPSKKSADYAVVTRLLHDQDGLVYVRARLYRQEYHIFYKCIPDSIKIGARVSVKGWERI